MAISVTSRRFLSVLLTTGALCLVAAQSAAQTAPTTPPQPEPAGIIAEPRFFLRGIDFVGRTAGDGSDRKNGYRLLTSTELPGAGWISGGGGFRRWFGRDAAMLDATGAVSWRLYKAAGLRLEIPSINRGLLSAEINARWQDLTQVTYFGDGPNAPLENRSEYRLTYQDVTGVATLHPMSSISMTAAAGWMRPTVKRPAGTFLRGNPAVQDAFPEDPTVLRGTQPDFFHTELSFTADTRDFRSHAARGGFYYVGLISYVDQDGGRFSTDRVEAEALHFVPLHERLILALHGSFAAADTGADRTVPLYLMPSLGRTFLRGYSEHRFHDREALVLNVETRFALLTHVDAVMFYDAGSVAPRTRALDLGLRSYGVGFSMHSRRATFARVDIAHGADGWLFGFRMSDPFHMTRVARRTGLVPFSR